MLSEGRVDEAPALLTASLMLAGSTAMLVGSTAKLADCLASVAGGRRRCTRGGQSVSRQRRTVPSMPDIRALRCGQAVASEGGKANYATSSGAKAAERRRAQSGQQGASIQPGRLPPQARASEGGLADYAN